MSAMVEVGATGQILLPGGWIYTGRRRSCGVIPASVHWTDAKPVGILRPRKEEKEEPEERREAEE